PNAVQDDRAPAATPTPKTGATATPQSNNAGDHGTIRQPAKGQPRNVEGGSGAGESGTGPNSNSERSPATSTPGTGGFFATGARPEGKGGTVAGRGNGVH